FANQLVGPRRLASAAGARIWRRDPGAKPPGRPPSQPSVGRAFVFTEVHLKFVNVLKIVENLCEVSVPSDHIDTSPRPTFLAKARSWLASGGANTSSGGSLMPISGVTPFIPQSWLLVSAPAYSLTNWPWTLWAASIA